MNEQHTAEIPKQENTEIKQNDTAVEPTTSQEELQKQEAELQAEQKQLDEKRNKLEQQKQLLEKQAAETQTAENQVPEKQGEEKQTAEAKPIISLGEWKAEYEATVGLKHRKPLPPFPCQDAAFAAVSPCAMVISADGAGSSETSDIGSQRVTMGIRRLVDTLYHSQFFPLDQEEDLDEKIIQRWSLILVKHAKGILEDLSKEYRRPAKDFRCTLLAAIIGKQWGFWLKVGDGALVLEKIEKTDNGDQYIRTVLGEQGKGTYANETQFISENLGQEDVQFGFFDSKNVSAAFSMSDGAALRLVSNTGESAAGVLSTLAQQLRQGELSRMALTKLFYSEKFLENHDGDDCSLALIAR